MRLRTAMMLLAAGCLIWLNAIAHADPPLGLRVLYIGHRSAEFQPLLKTHFARVESAARETFQPQAGRDFDVVLLDWPQGELARQERQGVSPLGKREEWTKPTVLLGSAGLNLAVAWKVKGGIG